MQNAATTRKLSRTVKRVVIFDNSMHKYQDLIKELEKEDWVVQAVNDKQNAINTVLNFQPSLIIINLFMSSSSNISLIREITNLKKGNDTKIIVVTSHYSEENIKKCISAGATDFIIEPFDTKLVLERLRFQFQDKDVFDIDNLEVDENELKGCFSLIYECQRILAEFEDTQKALFECLRRISDYSSATRVNIMMASLEDSAATVICSSDSESFKNKEVDLDRYPEVREVLLKSNIIFIRDVNSNPLTQEIKGKVKDIEISSLAVLPIRHRNRTVGTLNVRLGTKSTIPSENDLKSIFIIAMAIAPKIAAKKLMKEKGKG